MSSEPNVPLTERMTEVVYKTEVFYTTQDISDLVLRLGLSVFWDVGDWVRDAVRDCTELAEQETNYRNFDD